MKPGLLIFARTPLMTRNREIWVFATKGFIHQLRAGILGAQETTDSYLNRHKCFSYRFTKMAVCEELSC